MEASGSSSQAIASGVSLPDAALHWSFSRGGGPGGQNVNKVNTRAMLTVHIDDLAQTMPPWALKRLMGQAGQRLAAEPDRLVITSADSRSQHANRQACVAKLREMVVRAMNRPRRRRATKPSAGSVRRRIETKKQRGRIKRERGGQW